MQRLYIAKNNYGTYYSKIENKHAGCSMFITVNLPKDVELERDFGTYSVDYYLGCYKTKNDSDVKPVIIVTKINLYNSSNVNTNVNPEGAKTIVNAYEEYNNTSIDAPF